ncbi:RidA family protein [Jannaschia sp. S6380]|uniref:RidA family protein n=1 Tax=Jannaschia sp. S6380 TaxID=2926408 RepID=UPI001FF6408B|nr:RidA family protein [Jannaschia sp. S6380]MCK0166854.1 RidA family protein [Jannaschia sp. S6380]
MRVAIVPPSMGAVTLPLSPAIRSGDHLFLTGMTGSGPDGRMAPDPEIQFHAAFDKIAETLGAAGLTLDAVVEMTSYHLDLRTHFDLFEAVCRARFAAPYPAWTAVEVAGLRREGALVEVRAIARATADSNPSAT